MNHNFSIYKKVYIVFLIVIGLSNSLLYFFSVGYRKSQGLSMHSLRPFYAIGTSPLPLVFDTKSYFSSIFIKFNYTDGTNQTIGMDANFLQSLNFGHHLKLHVARYSFTGLVFESKKLNSVYCNIDFFQNRVAEKNISSFTILTYYIETEDSQSKNLLTTLTKDCVLNL